ncbi:MAG: NUDIX hydrolase, partial [Pseudomonadota bacterium]
MSEQPPKDAIRDAATVILIRRDAGTTRILMGQRGKNAAFFPSKFVFPGGAIDPQDHLIEAAVPLAEETLATLATRSDERLGPALAMTAIRELWEESGQAVAVAEGAVPA